MQIVQDKGSNSNTLDLLGKHYLVSRKFDHSLKRHYTVTNCMKKEVYQEYQNAIQ
jgi:hypothetical protein